jgi:hypothetical protein
VHGEHATQGLLQRHDGDVGVAGRALLDGEQTRTAWLAIEGVTAKPVVFMAPLGVVGSIDWPHGNPPDAHATYSCGPRMIRKLEHAVGDLV